MTHLCDLGVCGEKDPGEGVRKAGAVCSKQTPCLVHVHPQLEDLLHWGGGDLSHLSSHDLNLVSKMSSYISPSSTVLVLVAIASF